MPKSIAYITDLHLDEPFPIEHGADLRKNWEIVLDDIRTKGIKHIVFGGDAGKKETNSFFFDSLKDFQLDMVMGNHDYYDEVIKHYDNPNQEGHAELYYSYDDEFCRYIVLDSSTYSIGDQQFEWLMNQLATTKPIILLVHHAILKVDTQVDVLYPLTNRDRIKKALLKHPNQVTIFCGHYHMDDEQVEGNIHQYVNPALSYQIIKEANPIEVHTNCIAYRIIELDEGAVKTQLITL